MEEKKEKSKKKTPLSERLIKLIKRRSQEQPTDSTQRIFEIPSSPEPERNQRDGKRRSTPRPTSVFIQLGEEAAAAEEQQQEQETSKRNAPRKRRQQQKPTPARHSTSSEHSQQQLLQNLKQLNLETDFAVERRPATIHCYLVPVDIRNSLNLATEQARQQQRHSFQATKLDLGSPSPPHPASNTGSNSNNGLLDSSSESDAEDGATDKE